jgi:tetratricopeptide (TPR) repeat protein
MARYWTLTGASEGISWLTMMLEKNPEPIQEDNLVLYANAHNRLGAIHYQQQAWLPASLSYVKARRFADRAGNRTISVSTKLNEGLVYTEQGQLDLARPLLTEAEEYYRLEGQTHNWLIALLNLGRLELRDGNYDEAERLLLQGSQAGIEELAFTSALCNLNLVSCALLQGKDANRFLKDLEKQEAILDVNNQALLYYLIGLSAHSNGIQETEALFNRRVEQLLSAGANISSFDLSLKPLVQKVSQ